MIAGKSFLNGLSITSGNYASYFKVLIKKRKINIFGK